ncbi:MAG: right-handed parallel beta-helix repeat-containing protein [Waterburya sp.]
MRFKYLVSLLAVSAGLATYAQAASAEVIVKWQAGDNSANIQKAIDSGDSMVIIPKADQPWLVGKTIYARKPNQKIVFKPGVVLEAQQGAFKDKYGSMVTMLADNVTLSGYQAEFKMRKADYANPKLYEKSDWRHNIMVRGVKGFVIEGLTLKDSGGDGISVAHGQSEQNQIPDRKFSSGTIRDVVAVNNYRQGLSIMSAQDLLVENSTFKDTSGTNPASGIDIEPDHDWQKLVNIKLNNNNFLNNERNGIKIALWRYYGSQVSDISIDFNGCKSNGNGRYGIDIGGIDDGLYNGPKGFINFKNCEIAGSGEHGISIRNDQINPANTFKTTFSKVSVTNNASKSTEFYPIALFGTIEPGGMPNIDFGSDFTITDNKSRPALFVSALTKKHGLSNINGSIAVKNAEKKPSDLGNNLSNVTLKFTE